jgi:hypothetical protein
MTARSRSEGLKAEIALQEETVKTKEFELRDAQYTLRELEARLRKAVD